MTVNRSSENLENAFGGGSGGGGSSGGSGSGGSGGGNGGGQSPGREFDSNGNMFFSSHGTTIDPRVPGGSFVSFGSKESDGYHKTSIVRNADDSHFSTSKVRGGAFTGGFWNHVSGRVTKR